MQEQQQHEEQKQQYTETNQSEPVILRDTVVVRDTVIEVIRDTVIEKVVSIPASATPATRKRTTSAAASRRKVNKEIAALKQQVETMSKQQEALKEALRTAAGTDAVPTESNIAPQQPLPTADKPAANRPIASEDVVNIMPYFCVQLQARKDKLYNIELVFSDLNLSGEKVREEFFRNDETGYPFKYVVGRFQTVEHAIRYCKFINDQAIVRGAFVVAYYRGRRIKVKEATEIIERLQNNSLSAD
jgi:hypothetical protein